MKIGGRRPPFPDADLIRTLAALLTETGLTEIEYAIGNRRIRIARIPGGPAPGSSPEVISPLPAAARTTAVEHPGTVKAPMVGTAYLAPQPGDSPFVRLGDSVAEGQPLLIIEAMKVMNQIRAHRPGRVAQILVADAQPVEYGAVLMLIE
ncbi:MAG TPA: acetyl-CoA carboxylase biotin carboxyl carrier protein subunit [Stellaceae bacterium]|nr:acetyl-CoA carboxylase biotin carboxyl carrier protein subunit [Stellaceae bacterium]